MSLTSCVLQCVFRPSESQLNGLCEFVQLKLFTWGTCTLETADSTDLQASRPMPVLQHVNVAEAVRLVVPRFTGQLKTLDLPFKPNATGQATNVCALQSIYSYLHKVDPSADSHEALYPYLPPVLAACLCTWSRVNAVKLTAAMVSHPRIPLCFV